MDTKIKLKSPAKRQKSSSSQGAKKRVSSGFTKDAFRELNEFRKDGFLCDFQIKVSGSVFKVHRNVLAARSKYFKEFFIVNSCNKTLELKQVQKTGLQHCIDFIYLGEIVISTEDAEPILQVAKLFQLYGIFELYFQYFSTNLNVRNCPAIKSVAEKFEAKKLKEQAEEVITENFDVLVKENKDFVKIGRRDLINYANTSRKGAIVWTAILTWVAYDYSSRKQHFPDILASINMSCFTLQELITVIDGNLVATLPTAAEEISREILRRFSNGSMGFTEENWYFMKSLFRTFRLKDLQNKVDDFVLQNFAEISKKAEFFKISKQDLVFYINAVPISRVTEKSVWLALCNWVKFHEYRQKIFPDLLKALKLSHFSLDFVKNVIKDEPFVAADTDCLKLVIDALCCLVTK